MRRFIGRGVLLAGALGAAFSCSSPVRSFGGGAGTGGAYTSRAGAGGGSPDASSGTSSGAAAGTHTGGAAAASPGGGMSDGGDGGDGGLTGAGAGAGDATGAAGAIGGCQLGETRSCSKDGALGACAAGIETCAADAAWGACNVQPAAKDTCAASNDDNCNGIANEGCACATGQSCACPAAVDTNTDAANCGACGHSCLGGACAAGMCQPLLLGTVPSAVDYARDTIVSGGGVYVFSQVGNGSPSNVWQTSATTPATPTEVKVSGTVSCIMNGKLFWTTGTQPDQIESCTLSNCAATTTPLVTATGSFTGSPGCDAANNELVWLEPSTSGAFQTIFRASSTGANARQITSFTFPNDGASWALVDDPMFTGGSVRRFFYAGSNNTAGSSSLYAITTDVVNASGIALITAPNSSHVDGVLADDALALVSDYLTSAAYNTLTVPLPNGITSGPAPVFVAGELSRGVLDSTSFYGPISSAAAIPNDAIVRCPRTGCTTPTILVRGQANPNYFAQDATALYWTTDSLTSTLGFSIWKLAK
ncbi:MAG: hypothetical protein ABI548_10730 [Polyangiaceae bacterium]